MMRGSTSTSYTPLPWRPNTARFASDLFVDDKPHPRCAARLNLERVLAGGAGEGLRRSTSAWSPSTSSSRDGADGPHPPVEPRRRRDARPSPATTSARWPRRWALPAGADDVAQQARLGVYQVDHEDANGQYEVNFHYADALTTADRDHVLQDDRRASSRRSTGPSPRTWPSPSPTRPAAAARPLPPGRRRRRARTSILDESRPARASGCSQLGSSLPRRHPPARPGPRGRDQPDGELLQAAATGHRACTSSRSGFTWVARVRQLRRQQPHADDPRLPAPATAKTARSRPGCNPVPEPRRHAHRRPRRHRAASSTLARPTSATSTRSRSTTSTRSG